MIETDEKTRQEYVSICGKLDKVLKDYRNENGFDHKTCLKACFDAYHFYKTEHDRSSDARVIPRAEIELIAMLGAVSCLNEEACPDYSYLLDYLGCINLAANIIDEIMRGFEKYYFENETPISRFDHVPAGCSELTVDMNDYDKMYEKLTDFVKWKYGMDDDEDEGEYESIYKYE